LWDQNSSSYGGRFHNLERKGVLKLEKYQSIFCCWGKLTIMNEHLERLTRRVLYEHQNSSSNVIIF